MNNNISTKELLYGIMISLRPDAAVFNQLAALCAPFNISETTLRTNLSRMASNRLIEVNRKGKTALYSLTGRSRRIGKNVAAGFTRNADPNWTGAYWGIGFSVPESQSPARHKIRTKLEAYRYASWIPGLWIRPELENEEPYNGLDDFGNNGFCKLLKFRPRLPLSKEDIYSMWKLDKKAETMKTVQNDLEAELSQVNDLKPLEAFKKRMIVGKTVIQTLSSDPLLPKEMLPANWPGHKLRILFNKWQEAVEPKAEEFYKPILEMEEKNDRK